MSTTETPTPESKSVNVQSGANNQQIDLNEGEELTVGNVRERLADVLNIAPTAIAIIGEDEVEDTRVLRAGDSLQFIKRSGSKG